MFESAMKIKTAGLRVLVLAGVGLGMAAGAEATPVTFGFEAVGDIVFPLMQPGSQPAIPIEAGDVLTGRFTFDPDAPVISLNSSSVSTFMAELQINVGDVELSIATLSIEVFDDSFSVGFPSLTTPPVFEDFDAIRLGCSPSLPAECQPKVHGIPGVGPFRVSVQISLLGDLSILHSTEVPGDLNLWNSLSSFRTISISFDSIDPNVATVFYSAPLAHFTVIPEPSAFAILVSFSFISLLYRRVNCNKPKDLC